jgi:hypothetical protein
MVSSKADATHQAVNRYDQWARTRESRHCAEGYEPIEPDGSYRQSWQYVPGQIQGKKADACSQPTYITEKEEYFVPNTLSRSNS